MAVHVCNTVVSCLLIYSCILLVSLLGCIFLALVMYIHYRHRKYAHIPSPPRDGFFVGNLTRIMTKKKSGMSYPDIVTEIEQECGPVFTFFVLWISFVSFDDPQAIKKLLSTESPHLKPYVSYIGLKEVYGTRFLGAGLVSQLDPVKHAKRRALFAPLFKRKYLVTLVDQFNASADLLIEKLSHKADGKTEVTMLDELNRTTLDVIAKVAFGLDLDAIVDDHTPFTKAITLSLDGIVQMSEAPFSSWNPSSAARKKRKEIQDAVNFLRETGRRCIEGKLQKLRNNEELHDDIITHILRETCQEGAEEIEMEELVDEFVTLFFAGQETTANVLSFCLIELGQHPEVMHRLRTEVEAVLGDRDYVESADVGKLEYMMLVLKETLRLRPPVTGTFRELAHDIEVKGYKIPKNTIIWLNSPGLCRKDVYFHDPLQFDPDRFKASDDKPEYTYFPFSLGTRSCIGQQFALIEARVLLARLLHKFNFDLVPGQGYDVLDQVTLKPKGRCRNNLSLVE